ncbi:MULTISPECIES: PA4642 family protein [Pseudomonas]|uniref:PA4642 family protein n=1 Tax=Pseudomonas TaxID=286 RepID=UPI002F260BE4
MRVGDFERFVGFFVEAGLDLDGKDEHGKTFVEQIADQRNAPEYIEIIDKARG